MSTEARPFTEKSTKPTDAALKTALGKSYTYYENLLASTKAFQSDWNFSKSSGWMQKIHDGKKALVYVIPLDNSFRISLTVREKERDELLNNKSFKDFHQQLQDAKKFPEGYALRMDVNDKPSSERCLRLLDGLVELRKS